MTTHRPHREEFPRAGEVVAYLWIVAILLSVLELTWWMCNRIVGP